MITEPLQYPVCFFSAKTPTTRTRSTSWLKKGSLCLLFWNITLMVFAGIFDPVQSLSKSKRYTAAEVLYRKAMAKHPVEMATTDLTDLLDYARTLHDQRLEMVALTCLGDYYEQKWLMKSEALNYYLQAFKIASALSLKLQEANLMHRVGDMYFKLKQYPQGFEFLLKAHRYFYETGYEKIPGITRYLFELGLAYYEFANYTQSVHYHEKALEYPIEDTSITIKLYNTLALSYSRLKEEAKATAYFQKAMEYAETIGDSAWIGIISGNLALPYFRAGQFALAKPLIWKDYRLSLRNSQWESAARSLILMVQVHLKEDSITLARTRMEEVLPVLNGVVPKAKFYYEYYRCKADVYFRLNQYAAAYGFQDTAFIYRDSMVAENDLSVLHQSELKIQTEKHLSDLLLMESDQRKILIVRNSILAVSILLLMISYLVFNRQRLKMRKNREIFALEKKRNEAEWHNSQQVLQTYMGSLREKNKLIETFKNEIEDLRNHTTALVGEEKEKAIEKLYHATILTEGDWLEFRRLFEKVHTNFFDRLKSKYPDLTLAEIRLMALTKLALSNTEIANMLGISPESVRKTSLRLRKKLNLVGKTDLSELVSAI